MYRECLRAAGAPVGGLDNPVRRRLRRAAMDRVPLARFLPTREKPGFPVLLHNLIAEFKAAGVTADIFARTAGGMGDEFRLWELAQIYAAYQDLLHGIGWADEKEFALVAEQTLKATLTLAADWPHFVADGFDNLTSTQLALVRRLSAAAHAAHCGLRSISNSRPSAAVVPGSVGDR